MTRFLVRIVAMLAVVVAVTACGGSGSSATGTAAGTDSTGTAQTASASGTATTTVSPSSSTATSSSTTTTAAAASSSTTTSAPASSTTTSATHTSCGRDCQPGAPTASGTVKPTNGKCPSGYSYLPPQDGGPALCVPQGSFSQSATTTNP